MREECGETGHTRTNARFVRAVNVDFEVTNYNPASCLNTYELHVTATNSQTVTIACGAVPDMQAFPYVKACRQGCKLLCIQIQQVATIPRNKRQLCRDMHQPRVRQTAKRRERRNYVDYPKF